METVPLVPVRLYRQLLGSSWEELAAPVRRFHEDEQTLHATGTFRVRHGANWLARWLVWLGGLPAASEAVAIRLSVLSNERGEEWRRSFAGQPMVSWQRLRPKGLLGEEMGPLEIRFRLEVRDGALFYHHVGTALRLGPLRVPLPRWCGPQVSAWEKSGDQPDCLAISVEIRLLLLGLLIVYEGTLTQSKDGEPGRT